MHVPDAEDPTHPPLGDADKTERRRAKLRAQTERILAMPVGERLRQLEAEAHFFSSVRPLAG